MSDYLLPEEILIEILVKVPVKSLIRGTSVCKQWRSLIRSPSFISTHLWSSTEKSNQALVRRYDMKECREHYMVIPKRGPLVINSLEFPFRCLIGYFGIVGSCDGLMCLFENHRLSKTNSQCVIIWNPAIRNHVVLPQPQFVNLNDYDRVVLGFGVSRNVYKVVRLVLGRKSKGNGFIDHLLQAEIFSLGTERWRKLSGFDVRGLVPQYPWSPFFFKGFVHWIAYDPIGQRDSILRFHVRDEVFGETMLPQELERVPVGTMLSLSLMGGRLGAFKIDGEVGNRRCEVWMMKDYGVKESWTKLYMIDSLRIERVIGFWGSNEALLDVRGCELVVSYNPETKGIRHVGFFGYTPTLYVDDYKESLVLLGGGYSGDSGEGLSRGPA